MQHLLTKLNILTTETDHAKCEAEASCDGLPSTQPGTCSTQSCTHTSEWERARARQEHWTARPLPRPGCSLGNQGTWGLWGLTRLGEVSTLQMGGPRPHAGTPQRSRLTPGPMAALPRRERASHAGVPPPPPPPAPEQEAAQLLHTPTTHRRGTARQERRSSCIVSHCFWATA